MLMAAPRDVREIISKLSSEKNKTREEGIRLLNSWLEGEKSISLGCLLSKKTLSIQPDEIPHEESWPFLLTLLTKCIALEISSNKRRPPKLLMAKTLRMAVQCAEDSKLSASQVPLLSVIKLLFTHIWEVVMSVPLFQLEYSAILRILLSVDEYRCQMRSRIYSGLVLLYLNKLVSAIGLKCSIPSNSKEEEFRCASTLHVLLENPPGDFPDYIREDVVEAFTKIFSYIRDEGKFSRKLMECINSYLIKDGPNLGDLATKIHSAIQDFLFRFWLTTHDRGLKASFILYATVQLKFCRSDIEEIALVDQLVDVVAKELDQCTSISIGMAWSDASRDDKLGPLGSLYQVLMELAAAVFYRSCKEGRNSLHQGKRLKMIDCIDRIKDGLMKGSWLWNCALCYLARIYGCRLDKSLLVYCVETASESLQRLLNNPNTLHSYEALVWLLRALQQFSSLLLPPFEVCSQTPMKLDQVTIFAQKSWASIWMYLMQGIPAFSNVSPVLDIALTLLGNMVLRGQVGGAFVPHDMWDLRMFKHMSSSPALYFTACYFSTKGVQGDIRDAYYLRKNLLRAVLDLVNLKEPNLLTEQTILLIPAASYALATGCSYLLPFYKEVSIFSESPLLKEKLSFENYNQDILVAEVLECSVETLSILQINTPVKLNTKNHPGIRIPRQIHEPLLHEMEDYISGLVDSNEDIDKPVLGSQISCCSLLCNFVYCSLMARTREGKSMCSNKLLINVVRLIDHIASAVDENCHEIHTRGSLFDASGSTFSSLLSFISGPFFGLIMDRKNADSELLGVFQSVEKLLVILGRSFSVISNLKFSHHSGTDGQTLQLPTFQESSSAVESTIRVVDIDLDADDGSKDADSITSHRSSSSIAYCYPVQHKLRFVAVISAFSTLSPVLVWKTLYDLLTSENDAKVSECILYSLCKYFPGSTVSISSLVNLLHDSLEHGAVKISKCANILTCVHLLLGNLLSRYSNSKNGNIDLSVEDMALEENFSLLGSLVEKLSEIGLPFWAGRVKLIDCICNFVLLEPRIAQTLIGRLLGMLSDLDYRVRLFLARRLGILFLTWDGHNELFHDICSNFGVELVRVSKDKVIKANGVLDHGVQSVLGIETAVITLAHLAYFSEKVEVKAVFMMCAAAATFPVQRKLVSELLDGLSKHLQYDTRTKYLEELLGSILARWIDCEVSLTGLLEVQGLFFTSSNAQLFVRYCCPWLLPALVLRGNIRSLELISEVAKQPLPLLVKEFFVPIFAVCMAVYCNGKADEGNSGKVLCESILQIAKISELERDDLIKKNMVSIVSFLLSLTTSSSDPEMPFFIDETVIICVQTIVDGFIEINNRPLNVCVVDKVNIFRPDRVFKFLLEMHYQISAAIHPRHKCHRLSSIEVLIRIIGQRAVTSSTSNYIFSILGHYIGIQHLQDQCCSIISTMLDIFKADSAIETIHVLGEQLQFLVSKLVACCIPSGRGESSTLPSRVIKLLSQLTVDADPLLYDFIKDLEPFPPLECLESVRIFHEDLCRTYSTRDRFLMFVRSSPHLPKELLLLSLQSLHGKLLMNDIIPHNRDVLEREWNNGWNCDSDIVNAVWNLFQLINTEDANDICGMLSDFVARIGIGDPYQVVFRLPDSSKNMHLYPSSFFFNSKEATFCPDVGISDDLLLDLLRLLKKYLVDDSVKTVDITVQTLQGILSTEKGQGALLALDSYERSVIEIHSKGVNLSLLEKVLLDIEKKHSSIDIDLDDSSIWSTMGKTYEIWICLLVHKLAGLCDDVILRLCREIVLLKAEVAKLLFSSVLVNLAWNDDSDAHMRELISVKIRDNIFVECNGLAKSIQVVLDALNRLRSFYVADCAASCFTTRQKSNRISSVSRSRYPSEKSKGHTSDTSMLCSLWPKVYWLSLDYLLVAKAAILCGSYFTAILYIEHWCEERFNGLMLGAPDFSHMEGLPAYIELLITAFTQINEPDAIYGVIQSHKVELTSQLALFEHEGNWSKALEYCDLLVRSVPVGETENFPGKSSTKECLTYSTYGGRTANWKYCKGLMRSLQNIGSRHVLDLYSRGLVSKIGDSEHDWEFAELQYEAAWRAGNWDFSLFSPDVTYCSGESAKGISFNENLHSCLRALQEGDFDHFHLKLVDTKKELVLSISNASWEAAEYIHSNISKLQILHHLGMAWELRWKSSSSKQDSLLKHVKKFSGPVIPLKEQLEWLNIEWNFILRQAQLQMKLLEPVIAFRRVMLQILDCKEFLSEDLLQAASTLRKGLRYSLATAALHELKLLFCQTDQERKSRTYTFGRLEEAKILRAQGQPDMAINLAKYLLLNYQMEEEASNIYRLIGKWLAETRSSNSRTILEKYLKHSVELLETGGSKDQKYISRRCQTFFQLAHYTDSLFKSYEERLASNEWQAALRLRKHKTKELEVLIRRMKSSTKGERTDYSVKIQELQKQLSMDREEAERLQDDRDNFLNLALEGYKRCLVIGGKYDLRVVFRIVSLWFSLHMRHNVVESMSSTAMEVQSYKFLPLVYQIASRLGISKEGEELISFQNALLFLVRKMAIEHPYHTIFQILALANGNRIKDKQRNKNSFVVDMDKKLAAENLLSELSSSHGAIIQQMKQMVEIYIKLAELETKKEDTNKKVPLPREIRSIRQLELVPVVTANIAVDPTCEYKEGTFPHFKGLGDSVKIMNGINVPKVVECLGSDGQIYRQLAKSGNDDLRQDAVMEQFFGIVNIFLQHHRDTWKRKLQIRTYKVVPFTPSAGLVEWVDRTIPLGEYLLGSSRNGGAHGRYGVGDWPFLQCRELMANDKDKRKAFLKVCKNFRPVMRYFFLERFLRPADWFERRLAYTRSVAASSMVGYIVGLGDRHSMNILIDEATAEVIHIDLGVAFEQGLMLKTPERVPFRLTRDIVDGMGVTGVEGVFRRCCEETLSVMRTNKEALLTIIEVFIHDPLYKWALSPLKALQRQKETNYDSDSSLESSEEACEGNRDAARAILRVKQKLDGYEDGEMRSVPGQVQQLIQDAIDTDRLCQMFPGWGAWL